MKAIIRNRTARSALAATMALLLGGSALAQETQETTFPRPHRLDRAMTVSPASADAPEAAPAEALWPDPLTFTRGNAAPLYLGAITRLPDRQDQRRMEIELRLLDATPETIDAAEVEEFLAAFQGAFQMIEPAIHRPRVRWDWPWQEQGYMTLLPHLSHMRQITRALGFQATLELSRDEFPAALRSIGREIVMALHVGAHDEAVYIEGLVGVGIASHAMYYARLVAERPGSPNLHRALMALPEPMFSLRTWIEMEHRVFRHSVPMLYEPEAMDEAAWVEAWRQFGGIGLSFEGWNFHDRSVKEQAQLARELANSRREAMIPVAVEYFASRGQDAEQLREQVERNPYPLLARYMTGTMSDYMGTAAALSQLPFEEAFPRLRALGEEAQEVQWWHSPEFGENGSQESLAPRFDRGLLAMQRMRQQIALAIAVEALRDHAAEHGEWPESLDQLRLHAPDDPVSGEPFEYRRDGGTFSLHAAVDGPDSDRYEWRVTLRGE